MHTHFSLLLLNNKRHYTASTPESILQSSRMAYCHITPGLSTYSYANGLVSFFIFNFHIQQMTPLSLSFGSICVAFASLIACFLPAPFTAVAGKLERI